MPRFAPQYKKDIETLEGPGQGLGGDDHEVHDMYTWFERAGFVLLWRRQG